MASSPTLARSTASLLTYVFYFMQRTKDTCACACLRMALAYRLPLKRFSEGGLARRCRCMPGMGCTVDDVFHAAQKLLPTTAGWLDSTRIETEMVAALSAGFLVVINVQVRVLPYLDQLYPRAWHSALALHIDADHIYLHDPDPLGGPWRTVDRQAFFASWDAKLYSAYRL